MRKVQAQLQSCHNTYTSMSNMLMTSQAANMNAIATRGGSPYRYEVRY